jgi:hypothetical protein
MTISVTHHVYPDGVPYTITHVSADHYSDTPPPPPRPEKCPHGHDGSEPTLADAETEKSECCGANVTYGDDGLYCKCCFAEAEFDGPNEGASRRPERVRLMPTADAPERRATVRQRWEGDPTIKQVEQYLPSNYSVQEDEDGMTIIGHD